MQTIFLDTAHTPDGKAVHAALQRLLALPGYYGGNADALYDCLSERSEQVNLWIWGQPTPEAEEALRKVERVVTDLGGQVRRG